jgi:transcriptional regulator with XRE-family HTH domain
VLSTTTVSLISAEKLQAAIDASGKKMRALESETGMSRSRISQLVRWHVPQLGLESAVALSAALDREVRDLFRFPDGELLVQLGLIDA